MTNGKLAMKDTFNDTGKHAQRHPLWFAHVGYKFSKDRKLEPVDPDAEAAFARYASAAREALAKRSNELA